MSRTAIALAVCLLVAGCAAPTAPSDATLTTDSPSSAATSAADDESASEDDDSDGDIAVRGGSLPVEHDRIFERTERLLGANVSPPWAIFVRSPEELREGSGDAGPVAGSESRSFVAVMGIGQETAGDDGDGSDGSDENDDSDESDDDADSISVAAYVPSASSVFVNERMAEPGRERALERTLAHEFVHVAQFQQGAFARTQDALDLRRSYSRDRYLAYVSVIEGAAVFVADEYDRRYLEGERVTVASPARYRASSSGVQYAISRYYFGHRYLQHRFDSPDELSAVYDDPPETTEQLLHNDTNGSEEPRELTVATDLGGNRTAGRTNVNGELFTRIALASQLNESRAAAGADGWGADRLVPVVGDERNYVWATRWDSPAEADEFEAALEEYLDSRANASADAGTGGLEVEDEDVWADGDLRFRVERTDAETVVLLAGNGSFVGSASVTGTNETVSVAAGA